MKQKVLTRRGIKLVDLNPRRAIRRHCHMCADYSWEEVESCQTEDCELHAFRLGNILKKDMDTEPRFRAIRRYCRIRCRGGDENEYQNCDMEICPLFPYRLKNNRQSRSVCTG